MTGDEFSRSTFQNFLIFFSRRWFALETSPFSAVTCVSWFFSTPVGIRGCAGIEKNARVRSIVVGDRFTAASVMPSSPRTDGVEGPEEDPLAIFTAPASGYAWIAPLGSFITGPVLPEEAHTRWLEELASSVCSSGASLLGAWPLVGHVFAV